MLAVFAGAIFLSALLLFLVQPMVGRMVLPVLGGAPAVWNTCMVFFQVLLLAGYLYAHLVTRYLRPAAQVWAHGVVVLLPVLTLPIALRSGAEAPATEFPTGWLLTTLGAMAAAPFAVLSTTGPLLQRWFSATDHARAKDPYFLYAASNAGSLLALLGYPAVVEPWLRLKEQSAAWSVGYMVLAALIIVCGVMRVRRNAEPAGAAGGAATDSSPGWPRRGAWLILAMAPSSLMIGATTFISTDLAPVPLLWIVPLSIYLVTMIVAYSRFGPAVTAWAAAGLPLAVLGLTLLLYLGPDRLAWLHVPMHLAVLATGAMACHGHLAGMRPAPARLTEYFLVVSLGGALGGVFNAIVAPLVFDRLLEYPIAIVVTCAAGMVAAGTAGGSGWPARVRAVAMPPAWVVCLVLGVALIGASVTASAFGGPMSGSILFIKLLLPCGCGVVLIAGAWGGREADDWARRVVLGLAMPVAAVSLYFVMEFLNGVLDMSGTRPGMYLQLGVTGAACLAMVRWPWRFAGAIAILMAFQTFSKGMADSVLLTERSFFGVHHVQLMQGKGGVELLHGTTHHGCQLRVPGKEMLPTSYYHPSGPAGQVFERLNVVGRVRAVGLIGLGTGAMATYARPEQSFTFFEIDPLIVRVAQDERYFTFLSRSKGNVRCEVGDGRKLMEKTLANFDVIVVDAFSSDSIPVHLITVEAMKIYADHLFPRGVILMHTSNRHLRLAGVVAGNAERLGMKVRWNLDWATREQALEAKSPSEWLVVARTDEDLEFLDGRPGWERADAMGVPTRVWTDDFSNVLSVFKAW